MARSTRLGILIKNIYTLWETLPSTCYILSDESSIPFYSTSNGYKNLFVGMGPYGFIIENALGRTRILSITEFQASEQNDKTSTRKKKNVYINLETMVFMFLFLLIFRLYLKYLQDKIPFVPIITIG